MNKILKEQSFSENNEEIIKCKYSKIKLELANIIKEIRKN